MPSLASRAAGTPPGGAATCPPPGPRPERSTTGAGFWLPQAVINIAQHTAINMNNEFFFMQIRSYQSRHTSAQRNKPHGLFRSLVQLSARVLDRDRQMLIPCPD